MIRIPNIDAQWFQPNRGKRQGSIQRSFNLDLNANRGEVRTTRTKRLAYTGNPGVWDEVVALERFNRKLYIAVNGISGDEVWETDRPFGDLSTVASISIVPANSDMLAWNNGLYLANTNEIYYTTDGDSWSELGSNVLTSGNHLLTAKNDVLYVSDEKYKVKSVTSANVFQGTGSQTLNLNLPGYGIQMLMTGIDSIWVGLTSDKLGAPTLVFEWDGEAENSPTARYEIDATGIMAGTVKNGVPYIVDSLGRLLVFSGGAFIEVARFPLNGGSFAGFSDLSNNSRAIHPRGMAVDGDEILINVSNQAELSSIDAFNDFPSGVWAYSEKNGLHHKFSPSYRDREDSGTDNLTDYGQYRAGEAGPIRVFETEGDLTDVPKGGRVLFASQYFTDGSDTTEFGLFTDDTADTSQKAGFIVLPRVMSSHFRDHWQKVYAIVSDLTTAGDLVEVKYRTKEKAPIQAEARWTKSDRFMSDTDLSDFKQGEEVFILQGNGAGGCYTIKNTTDDNEIVLDRAVPGVESGMTSLVQLENWTRVGSITDIAHQGFNIGAQDHWIEVKLYLQWTGPRELHGIIIDNEPSI